MSAANGDKLGWVSESRGLGLLGLARSTHQTWEKENLVESPRRGVYGERDLLELLLLTQIRERFSLAESKSIWRRLRSTEQVEAFLVEAEAVESDEDRLDLVLSAKGEVALVSDDAQLTALLAGRTRPETFHLVPLAALVHELREGFDNLASRDPVPVVRRGRPRRQQAEIKQLRTDSR